MPQTYYDSELSGEQIESALEAIDGVVTPSNNGKILRVKDGNIEAVSASEYTSGIDVEPLNVTENNTYTAPSGKAYSPVTVNVSGGGGGGDLPSGGSDGDVLIKSGTGAAWTSTPPQMGSLATIEPTSSASKAYAAGDYLIYNGQLYKATGTISPAATLTPGGNIQAVTNGGFNDLNAFIKYVHNISAGNLLTAGEHFNIGAATYTRIGNLVCWQVTCTTSAAANVGDIIASGFNPPFFPSANIVTVILFDQGDPNTIRLASLYANGDLKTNVAFSAAGIGIKFNLVYATS